MESLHSKLIIGIALLFTFGIFANIQVRAGDPKPEEIIAKHLDSIGTKEKREAVKNRLVGGVSQFESKLPSRKTGGKAVIVSDAKNLFFISSFNSQEYPFEKIGFFDNKINLPYVTAGTRSPLGAFIADHSKILSEGLFSGSISSFWSLLNPQLKIAKLDSEGTRKIDGRKAYVLGYLLDGTAGKFTVKLFFDAETFQHIRTQYRDELPERDKPFGTLGVQSGVKIEMVETFADFKTVEGLTLPHSYKIKYITDSSSGVYEYNWAIAITKYTFNQNLDSKFFSFEEK